MFVLFIALLHAVPVLIVGYYRGTKPAVVKATLVMTTIAVLVGGAKFGIIDLVGVAVGYYFANRYFVSTLTIQHVQHEELLEPEPDIQHEKTNKESTWTTFDTVLTILVAIALLSYILKPHNVKPINSNFTTSQQIQLKDKTNKYTESNSNDINNEHIDLRHCLNLSSNEEIISCTEKNNK